MGATLMPGMIDAHGHVIGMGFQLMLHRAMSDTRISLAEAQALDAWLAAAGLELQHRLDALDGRS